MVERVKREILFFKGVGEIGSRSHLHPFPEAIEYFVERRYGFVRGKSMRNMRELACNRKKWNQLVKKS